MAESDSSIPLDNDLDAIDIEGGEESTESGRSQISMFGSQQGKAGSEDKWQRQPNSTGHGAVHLKLFHAKLREDALEYLEGQVNDWLDKHPECEVKFSQMTVGQLKSKHADEPALFMSIWV